MSANTLEIVLNESESDTEIEMNFDRLLSLPNSTTSPRYYIEAVPEAEELLSNALSLQNFLFSPRNLSIRLQLLISSLNIE